MSSESDKKNIKNVIIVNDFNYIQGGASKVAIDTANALTDLDGINVYFFSAGNDNPESLNKKVINISTNQGEALKDKNKLRGFINGIYNFKAKNKFRRLLKSLNQSETVIHIHGWTKCLSSSVFDIAFRLNFKTVLTLHDYFTACPNGGYFNYKKNMICSYKPLSLKCLMCNCDSRNYYFKVYRIIRQLVQNKIVKLNKKLTNVVTISEFSEKVLTKTLSKKTIKYRIYNPIDLDINIENVNYKNNNYFLYVGRVSKEKGVDVFCEAISKIKEKGIVVGDGDQLEYLKNKYPSINFVGWKNNEEVKNYMKNSKALIFPSRWYEAAPLTPLEIMQYGIPVITSDCCATIEYVDDSNLHFNINNIDTLIACIKYVNSHNLDVKIDDKIRECTAYKNKVFDLYNKI